jgi:hypothetical protein
MRAGRGATAGPHRGHQPPRYGESARVVEDGAETGSSRWSVAGSDHRCSVRPVGANHDTGEFESPLPMSSSESA